MSKSAGHNSLMLTGILHGPWVGRVLEMADAINIWQQAASGKGQVLFIHGEPGVGKTRFVHELSKAVIQAGGRVLTGECFAEGSAPYAPVQQLIREALDTPANSMSGISANSFDDLLTLIPSWRSSITSNFPDQILNPEAAQEHVFEGFIAFCSALSTQAPLLLFVDDVHWADTATLSLLRSLARRGRKLPLLIVMTYREAELDSAPALDQMLIDLNRERLATALRLARLGREETRDLLGAMFGEDITPEFLDGIYTQTEGNPFFIEEICKALIESGAISYQEGTWHRAAMAEMKLPQTVRSAIQERLKKLSSPAQETLRMAAILGGEFDFKTLQSSTGFNEEILITSLESAVRAQLITEIQSEQKAAPRFGFVHLLIPTTIRESMIHVRRSQFHQRAAQAIEAIRPDDFEAIAYHYAEAGEDLAARDYFARAGYRAQPVAPGEAARFYRAALDRWPVENSAERADLLARLGYCLWVMGDENGGRACYESAYTIFDTLGDHRQSGEMQRRIGRMDWERADRESALRHYHQALAILEQGPETPELARAISSISAIHMTAHENLQGIHWGERALALAERLGAEDVVVDALNNIGSSYSQSGDFETGLRMLQDSLERALAAGLTQDACRAYYNSGVQLQRQCRYHDALDQYEHLSAYASRVYAKKYANEVLCRQMWTYWWTGHWNVALAFRTRVVEFDNSLTTIWTNRICGMIDLDLGRLDDARRELEGSFPGALQANEIQTTIPHMGQLVRLYDALGFDEKAAEVIHQMLAFLSNKRIISIESTIPLLIACQWMAAHNLSDGMEKAHFCLDYLQQLAIQFPVGEPTAALQEARGDVLLAEKHPPEAVECFHQAAATWGAIGRSYDQARALASLGRVLLSEGENAAANIAHEQAHEIYNSLADQLDADSRSIFLNMPLVQAVQPGRQASVRGKQPRTTRRELNQLTERELEVLNLVAQGLTNAQIASRLVLSPLTVNAHLRSIYGKLDVTTRTAAVHCAIELGLF